MCWGPGCLRPLNLASKCHDLFSAQILTDRVRKFDEGKAVAYSALCRLICRHTEESVPVDLLAHFYEIVKKVGTDGIEFYRQCTHCNALQGLCDGSGTKVSWDIIRSTSSIFSLAIPGVNILVPYYLLEIRNLVSTCRTNL